MAGPIGSNEPVFTLPAWSDTISGPFPAGSASASESSRMRPCSSDSTEITRERPIPRYCNAVGIVACASDPMTTAISGAPNSPRSSTSQPARSRTRCRAAARHVTCAIWQPVVRPMLVPSGRPSRSTSQDPITSSTTDADGPAAKSPAFWSQVDVSQSAASAAGKDPPITNPK